MKPTTLSLFDPAFLGQVSGMSAGDVAIDGFESYPDGESLDGKNDGTNWTTPWVSRSGYLGVIANDDFESYTEGGTLNDKSGGDGFNTNWASR